MSVHLSDEEQVEALKRWWSENGKSLLSGAALALVVYFGYQSWQAHQREASEAASAEFAELLQAAIPSPGQALTDEQSKTAAHLADSLKSDDNFYGQGSALLAAKLAVDSGDLDKAASELAWLVENSDNKPLVQLARLRLARVQAAQQDFDAALTTLGAEAGAYVSAYAETRGDVYLAMGDAERARAAYLEALNNLDAQSADGSLLQVKLNDLALGDA